MNGTCQIWSTLMLFLLACCSPTLAGNVPEEALRHMARGEAAVEMARSPKDFERAIAEFQAATRIAPRWADPHYNLGLVREKAGKYDDAIRSFKTYLSLNPQADDAAGVRTRIYKLEYKVEQTISREDALNIFGSLWDKSRWQLRLVDGDMKPKYWYLVRGLRREGDRIDITYNSLGSPRTKSVKPIRDGKHLRFQADFDKYWCGRESVVVRGTHEMEIVSRQKVVVNCVDFYPQAGSFAARTMKARLEYVAR